MVELKRKRNFHTTVDEQSFDLEQGDPCAAAEGRLKRGIKPYTVICCCMLFLLALAVVVVLAIFLLPLISDKLFRPRDGGEGAAATTDRAQWDEASSRPAGTPEGEAAHSSTNVEARRTGATRMVQKSTAPSPSTHPATTSGLSLNPLTGEQSTAASVSTTGAVGTTRQEVQTSGPTTPPPLPTIKRPAAIDGLLPPPGDQSTVHCGDYYRRGNTTSMVYKLRLPEVGDFHAYCEMVDGDGWMVLQRRTGPEPPLFWDATFNEYASGFGNVSGDHWLGLERVHALGRDHQLQLRIIVNGDFCASKGYCSGQGTKGRWQGDWKFKISDRADGYRMEELSYTSGTLSHPLNDFFSASALKQRFTTIDVDNDGSSGVNCAEQKRRGGWWHGSCKASLCFLNGQYNGGTAEGGVGDNETGQHQFWTLWVPKRDGSSPYRIKPMSSVMMVRVVG